MKATTRSLIAASVIVFLFPLVIVPIYEFTKNEIIVPAYISTSMSCAPQKLVAEKHGAVQLGSFEVRANSATGVHSENLTVVKDYADHRVLKHETVHKVQYEQGRLFSCAHPVGVFIDELEAYTMQRLPDGVYERVYGVV